MKAYITSINEPTTGLCEWQLKRFGFEVEIISGEDSLACKLSRIYNLADDDFLRVDADVIVNKNIFDLIKSDAWWCSGKTYDIFKNDVTVGGVQYITKQCLPILRGNVGRFINAERPESQMFRLDEFHNPRVCTIHNLVDGIHGFGIKQYEYVRETKNRRKQFFYDWELYEKLVDFYK